MVTQTSKKRNRVIRNMSIGVVIAVLLLAIFTVFWLGTSWPLVGGLVVVVAFFTLVIRRHAQTTHYTCPSCSHSFQISAWTDFLSPHFPDKKLLVCPHCDATDWCRAN